MQSGIDGFLGTRAPFTIDLIVVAMAVMLPIIAWSIYQARVNRRYALHKRVNLIVAISLLLALIAFEVEIRVNGWRDRAAGEIGGTVDTVVYIVLAIHISIAIITLISWIVVITRASRNFSAPPKPGQHSKQHIPWARVAATSLVLTTMTGWTFYVFAFV